MPTVFAFLLLSLPAAEPQALASYRPLSGEETEQLLDKVLPRHKDLASDTRLALTVRILPPFEPEAQLALVCGWHSQCKLTRAMLNKSLQITVNEVLSKGASIASLHQIDFESRVDAVPLQPASAQVLLTDFWRAMAAKAESSKKEVGVMNFLGTERTVTLDATTYQISVSQGEDYLQSVIPGPSPSHVEGEAHLDPLVQWSLGLWKEIDRRLQRAPKPKE